MKNLVYVLIILLIGFLQISNAQEPVSFRSSALGGIIDDDLDLVYDPIELSFVKGIRVYTNLSNLTSNQEQLLNGISDNEFLFGVSANNPFLKSLWTSALIRFSIAQNSNAVNIDSDLDGWNDKYGDGILESNFTAFLDNDADADYDVQRVIFQRKTDINQNNNRSFILNNALELDNIVLGLKFVYGSYNLESTVASWYHGMLGTGANVLSPVSSGAADFNRSVRNNLIAEDYTDNIWSEDGDFKTDNNSNYFNIGVSCLLKNFRNYEIRGDLFYNHDNSLYDVNDKYSGKYEYFDPNIPNYEDNYSEKDSYKYKREENGGKIFLGVTLRKTFDKKEQRKDDGYWRVGAGMFFGSYDYTNATTSIFSSEKNKIEDQPLSDHSIKITTDNITKDNGDKSVQNYMANIKVNYPFGERVYFGMGGYFNYTSTNRKTDFIESYDEVTNYTRIDNTSDYFDYVRTESESITADRTYDISNISFQAPVGVEYRFTENMKWSLRFGTIFNYYNQKIIDKKKITKSEPYTTVTNRGDGSSSTYKDDNEYASTKEETKTTSSNTVFSYGLGYNPTENLQIDLLGFFGNKINGLLDSDFYRSLRLSFSLKF
jgi:hypothetical protein